MDLKMFLGCLKKLNKNIHFGITCQDPGKKITV